MARRSRHEESERGQRERIDDLRRQVEAAGGMVCVNPQLLPPALQEVFLSNVLAFERAERLSLFRRLEDAGVKLPDPALLPDDLLHAKLWEMIEGLASMNVVLECTDHLSDRELYEHLWGDVLREPTVILPDDPSFIHHIDLLGSGSDEHMQTFLRYFADEKFRSDWRREFPDAQLPEPAVKPHDRDRYLPTRER